jgi:hypothetical protein
MKFLSKGITKGTLTHSTNSHRSVFCTSDYVENLKELPHSFNSTAITIYRFVVSKQLWQSTALSTLVRQQAALVYMSTDFRAGTGTIHHPLTYQHPNGFPKKRIRL